MSRKLPKRLFITGTDTDIGKTLTSTMICLATKRYYWKPIQTGASQQTDTQTLKQFINKDKVIPESYIFKEPLSPHQAAFNQDVTIDTSSITIPSQYSDQELIIEGAGGLLVPINDHFYMIDLIKQISCPVIIVARSTLGTLNHTLLSIEALRIRNIPLLGIVLIGPFNKPNKTALEYYGKTRVLWEIPILTNITSKSLINIYHQSSKQGI